MISGLTASDLRSYSYSTGSPVGLKQSGRNGFFLRVDNRQWIAPRRAISTALCRTHRPMRRIGLPAAWRLLAEVVDLLIAGKPLARRHVDHQLTGEWKDFRDCHIRPDLVLI